MNRDWELAEPFYMAFGGFIAVWVAVDIALFVGTIVWELARVICAAGFPC